MTIGRGRYKHYWCDETVQKLINRDARLDIETTVGEYRLVKKHKVVLRAEITEQKK